MKSAFSRAQTQVNRLLNPTDDVTLSSLQRAAAMIGRKIRIEMGLVIWLAATLTHPTSA